MKFRSKIQIEAYQLTKDNREQICLWANNGISGNPDGDRLPNNAWYYDNQGESELYIKTNGEKYDYSICAIEGDWIVKYLNGSGFDIFSDFKMRQDYEEVITTK